MHLLCFRSHSLVSEANTVSSYAPSLLPALCWFINWLYPAEHTQDLNLSNLQSHWGENVNTAVNVPLLLLQYCCECRLIWVFVILQGDVFTLPYNASIWLKIGLCFETSEPNFLQAQLAHTGTKTFDLELISMMKQSSEPGDTRLKQKRTSIFWLIVNA